MTHEDVIQSKIHTLQSLQRQVAIWRLHSKKIIFSNGCFDLLHLGHIDYLTKAADCGDYLVVAVNSDASVKRLNKGKNRPLQDEYSRAKIMASLHFVSAVIIFNEDTPSELIKQIEPEVLVKGADYDANETNSQSKKYIVGSDFVRQQGGEVKTIEFLEGFSTSAIEQKIKQG
jgi:rfaE bifunctional protein nucleotidyltransferase chain/domain